MLESNSYSSTFYLIISDFKKITYYIEPLENHFAVYSHRIYELYLRSCTEFESVCKDLVIKNFSDKKWILEDMGIKDYNSLNSVYRLGEIDVGLLYLKPNDGFIKPFKDWNDNKKLCWWESYNNVKHNRNNNFQEANLGNLIQSIAGLFTLLAIEGIILSEMGFPKFDGKKNTTEIPYYDYLHSIRRPA